jgi:hypothetical protein
MHDSNQHTEEDEEGDEDVRDETAEEISAVGSLGIAVVCCTREGCASTIQAEQGHLSCKRKQQL